MSASEKCVSHCKDVDSNGLPFTLTKCDVCKSDDIATARADGETAGYARGRREAFSEGAELLARLCYCCADDDNDTEARDCMACQCAAALRAKAVEEKP